MKVKSSIVLAAALVLIESGEQSYACAAIQDVETTMRWDENQDIQSKAMAIWMTFKPKEIREAIQTLQVWWPKGDLQRIETLKLAVAQAKKQND